VTDTQSPWQRDIPVNPSASSLVFLQGMNWRGPSPGVSAPGVGLSVHLHGVAGDRAGKPNFFHTPMGSRGDGETFMACLRVASSQPHLC
jgi:hypothetical protein